MNVAGIRIAGIAIIICVALIVGIIIYKIYKSKVNKALAGETSGAHIGVPAPADTFSVLIKIVVLILLVWIIISLGNISELKQEIENLRSANSSDFSSLAVELSQLKSQMAEANSRILSYNRYISDVNAEDNTCTIKHTLRLKTYSDATTVKLTLSDGTQLDMHKRAAGIYEADTKINLFMNTESATVFSVKEGDMSYAESASPDNDDADEYWQLVIPELGNSSFDIYYGSDKINIGTFNIFSYHKAQYHISSAKLLIEKNGEILETIDAKPFMNEALGDGNIPVDKEYDIKSDDTMNIRLILTTDEGYTLNQQLFEKVKESGIRTYGNRFSITDKNGQVVYKNFG